MTVAGTTGLIGLVIASVIIVLIRRDQMQIGKATFWLVAAIVFASLWLAPAVFDDLAKLVGVDYAPALAFTIALGALALKSLLDDIEISRLELRQRRLFQRVAILQAELERHDNLSGVKTTDSKNDAEPYIS